MDRSTRCTKFWHDARGLSSCGTVDYNGGCGSIRAAQREGLKTRAGQAPKVAKVMCKEFGINISSHRTVAVVDLDLVTFDLVAVFQPSAAQLSIPEDVPVAYLDVAAPTADLSTRKERRRA